VPCEELTPQRARQLEPALSGALVSALRIEPHGYVSVEGLMAALRAACTRLGVERIYEPIADVSAEAGPAADAFVIAAGSWSGQVRAGDAPPVPVKPIRGQRLQLRCETPPLSQIAWGPRCYLVPWLDGRVLVGATVEDVGFDERSTEAGVSGLRAAAAELVPALGEARLEGVRAGLRPLVAGELPVIGRSSTMHHVFYATGHYRNGVLLAPLTAALIADLVLHGREHPDLAFVRPDRHGL
jgi:glycine oxidase